MNRAHKRKPSDQHAGLAPIAPAPKDPVHGSPDMHAPQAAAHQADVDELDAVFAVVARHFSLLAEPTRLKILHAICSDERSVSQIVTATGATQTNVSRHLALMHQAGVVTRRREGSAVFYRVDNPEFVEICRNVCIQIASRIDGREPLKRGLLDFANEH